MRALSYILILVGLGMLGSAGYQQFRGVAVDPLDQAGKIHRDKHPENFDRAMAFLWLTASSTLFAGTALWWFVRRQERLDPLSPEFHWKDDKEA